MSTGQHRCQIDCTNHDQVITALQLKSKDLYYFWRNYEWLYNRYVNEQQPAQPQPQQNRGNIDKLNRQIEELQNQNDQLTRQNRNLKRQLEGLRRDIQDQSSSNKYEAEYRKETTLLRNNYQELKLVNEQQQQEISRLQSRLKQTEGQWESERHRLTTQNRANVQRCVELQQAIDQLRHQPAPMPIPAPPKSNQGIGHQQIEQLRRRQTTVLTSQLKQMGEQAQAMMKQECQALRQQLEERFGEMLSQMSQRELNSLIVEASQ